MAGAAEGVIQEEIAERLDAIGKYLQEMAGLQTQVGKMARASLEPEIKDLLEALSAPGSQADAQTEEGEQPTVTDPSGD